MGTLLLLQVALDLGFIAIITVFLIERSKARRTEDPRMSRGLQLLSSKIAIIQDLMDRTETSSKQLTQLLEAKQQDVQEAVENVERHLHKVSESMEKSKNIARLFQDKIPHEEIIERQNAQKYLKAAKFANQGLSIDEIAKQIDIPRGELELIVKLNRQNLVASQDNPWLEEDVIQETATVSEKIDEGFQPAVIGTPTVAAPMTQTLVYTDRAFSGQRLQDTPTVRPVIFKKIVTDSSGKS